VIRVLNAALIPYFVLEIKNSDRLAGALTTVEFLRDHCLPKLRTRDAHEVRLALEAENLVTNAEMKLRASLFRTESRGRHYREDFPDGSTRTGWPGSRSRRRRRNGTFKGAATGGLVARRRPVIRRQVPVPVPGEGGETWP